MKSALFPRFGENLRPVWRFWQLWRLKMRFGQNVLRMTWKARFVQFLWKAHFFPFWREFQASVTILTTLTLKIAIWPKRAAHDLKQAFCTIFIKSALFSRFDELFRPVWRFWQLWRSQMQFGQNVLRLTWKERFVQFSWKANCLHVLKEFKASVTILRTLTPKNAIWPKRAAHDLKRAFCTIFMKSAQFSRFEENFRPVWRFWQLWRSKMRFGQNVLRMTWKERFLQFSWKAHCFSVLKRIWDKSNDFEKFDPEKYDLGKTSCAWPEKSVLYNFHENRTVSPFWREFEASVTILTTLTL